MKLSAVVLLAMLVACGRGTGGQQAAAPSACDSFMRTVLETPDASPDVVVEAARDDVAGDFPDGLEEPAAVVLSPSSSEEERDAATKEIGTWFQTECGGPEGDDVRLVPGSVPDRLTRCSANDVPTLGPVGNESTVSIWGDVSLPDPWAGPLVGTWIADRQTLPVHDDAEPTTVHGVNGFVAPMPLFQAISSQEWGHIVTWRDPSGPIVEVAVRGAEPLGAVATAELVTVVPGEAPFLGPDVLGGSTALLHSGAGLVPYGFGAIDGWMLSYLDRAAFGSPAGPDPALIFVTGTTGDDDDLQTLRFWAVTSQPVSVRGHDGIAYAAFDELTGPFGVAWEEAPGHLVKVVALGFDAATVDDVVSSLERKDSDAWREIKRATATTECLPMGPLSGPPG